MKLLPLVIHAGMTIPRWTSIFSDALQVSSMDVVSGGLVTINCSTNHGFTIGRNIAISVTDAPVPNPITAAVSRADGDIEITTEFEHDYTGTPDDDRYRYFADTITLTGFASAQINGNRQLVSAPDGNTLIFRPAAAQAVGPIALTGNEKLLDRLDAEVTGWHSATVTAVDKLTFATPSGVSRNYSVSAPTVVTNIRIAVALHPDAALAQLTQDGSPTSINKAHLFILPVPVRSNRSRMSTSAAIAELGPGADMRLQIMDGFTVLIFLPSVSTSAHAKSIDKAHGEIFKAVLRTFHGLRVPRSELGCGAQSFVSIFTRHQGASVTNKAIYAHEFDFESLAHLSNEDAISPWDWANLDDAALDEGTIPDGVTTVGTVPFRELDITGILHYGHPSPLTGNVRFES